MKRIYHLIIKIRKKIKQKIFTSVKPMQKTSNFNIFSSYTHILHTGENITGLSHLDLWLPHFKNADINFMVLVRNYELYKKVIIKYKNIPIVFVKNPKDINLFLNRLVAVKAIFYPSNTGNNLHLLHFNDIKHIFIGHGDSDKTASAHKYFRVYDENWVAGEAHIDRFKNAGFDFSGLNQVKVGRPNLKEILELSNVPWKERFHGELNLLYLSTWEGVYKEQNYTSVYHIIDFFKEVKNFKNLDIKLHPFLGKRDKSLLDFPKKLNIKLNEFNVNHTIHGKEIPVDKIIKNSNIFICDISAVVTECLAANAPIFVYIPKDKNIKLAKSKMNYEDYTYIFSEISELIEKLEKVLNGDDYLKEKREEALEYILGRKETLDEQFVQELKKA